MKLIVAAIALLCLAQINAKPSASFFKPGYQYRYKYLGQTLTNMPDDPQTAAIAHKGSVLIVAEKDAVYFKIERLQSAKLNEILKTVDMEKIPYEFQELGTSVEKLYSPIKVFYDRGLIKEFESERDEITEITNLKKAILTPFQLKLDEYFKEIESDQSQSNNGFATYEVMEDGIAGECVVQYVVEVNPHPSNPTSEVLNITKMKDFEECNSEPEMIFSSHAPNNCSDCEADDFDPIDTLRVLEYEISNKDEMMTIERIESRARTVFIPFTTTADQIETNHSQIFVLKEVSPIVSQLPRLASPQRFPDLQYDFPNVEESDPTDIDLHRRPIPFMPLDGKKFPQEVRRLLDEVSKEIAESHKTPMIHTPYKAQQLARAFRTLEEKDIAQIFQDISLKPNSDIEHIKKRLAIDTVLMCGSLPCLTFLLTLVESRQVSEFKSAEILTALPFYIRRPTSHFIDRVLKTCENQPKKGDQVHSSCWLAFGSLVDQACGPDETNVPTSPNVDSYCTQEQERHYTQAVWRQLHAAQRKDLRLLFLQTLSIMGLDAIVEVIKPYASGQIQVSEMVRVKAIFALAKLDDEDAFDDVLEIVAPIFMNKDESTIVRTAAMYALAKMDSRPHFMERLAAITWDEDEDDQLTKTIYSFLDNLANSSYPCRKEDAAHALNSLGFASEQDVAFQDSQFRIFDFYDEEFKYGSLLEAATIANNASILPRAFYVNLERTLAGFSQTPFQGAIHIEGLESTIKRLVGPQSAFENLNLRDIFSSNYDKPPKNYHELFQKLNIDPRDDESLAVSIYAQFLTSQNKMFYFDAQTVLEYIQQGINGIDSILNKALKVNYQKTLNLGSIKYQIPSSLGLPIYLQIKTPAIFDLKGEITVSAPAIKDIIQNPNVPKVISSKCSLRPTISFNLMTTMGVMDPFKKIYALIGVTSESYVSLPHQLNLEVDLDNAKVKAVFKPVSHVMNSPEVTLFRHVVKPFAALYPYDKFTRIEKFAKIILDDETPDEYEFKVGQELLGLPAKFSVKSDLFWQDQGSFIKYFFEDNTPLSLLTLWFATPDFNYREYVLTMDTSAAINTELTAVVDIDYLPSKIQEMLSQSQSGIKGLLAPWLGWSKMPWQCDILNSERFDQSASYKTQTRTSSKRFPKQDQFSDDFSEDYSDYSVTARAEFDDDDDDFDNDDDFERKQHSSYKSATHKSTSFHKQQSRYRRDLLRPTEPATIQKIPFTAENAENKWKIHLEAHVRGNVNRAVQSQITLSRNVVQMVDSLDLKVKIDNPPFTPDSQLQVCAKGQMRYPKLPCDYESSLKPQSVSPINGRLEISYGPQCGAKKIAIYSEHSKTEEQLESERKGDSWIYDQCKEDFAEGKKLSDACDEVLIAMGDLKKTMITIDYQYNDLPRWGLNVSHKIENFLKYYLYDHMSANPIDVVNPDNKLIMCAEFDVDDAVIDLEINKPRENIEFNDVYYPEMLSSLLRPLNARFSTPRLIVDDLVGGYAPPTCKVMGDFIENFDNTTYKAPLSPCKHVITKDCSSSDLFSVLMSKTEERKKELEIHLLRHSVIVRATSAYSGQFEVIIDGQTERMTSSDPILMISHQHPEGKGLVLASILVVGPFIEIRAAYHGLWVKFDGVNAKISLSNVWRGDVCGLCSEFDGDSSSTLIGPQQCEYADVKDFLASYFVPSTHCQKPPPSNRKICPDADISPSSRQSPISFDPNDDDDDDDDDDFTTPFPFDDDDDDEDDQPFSSKKRPSRFGGDPILRNRYIVDKGRDCFSVTALPECKPGSYPTESTPKVAGFVCPKDQSFANKMKQYRGQKPLTELRGNDPEFFNTVSVPKSCR